MTFFERSQETKEVLKRARGVQARCIPPEMEQKYGLYVSQGRFWLDTRREFSNYSECQREAWKYEQRGQLATCREK